MKNICFESYRQSKRDKWQQYKPKPKQLDSTWYTDNIYSNRSEDLEEDFVPDCLKYGTYRKLRNIREQDEFFTADDSDGGERRGEGEGSSGYGLQRSTSCKEFNQFPIKSQSWHMDERHLYDGHGSTAPVSILKNRGQVPKSYSFSATSKTTPFDVMDYELPPAVRPNRRDKQEAFRRATAGAGYFYSNSLDDSSLAHAHEPHSCCAREHCTNAKCLLEEIYPSYGGNMNGGASGVAHHQSWRRAAPSSSGMYSAGASGGSNRNLHANDWILDSERGSLDRRMAAAMTPSERYTLHQREREQSVQPPPPPTVICCCTADDYCYHHQQQHHMARSRTRLHCPGHHPAAEEEEHMHCRAYDTDLDHYIRDERERLMMQDKFLDEDERYLQASSIVGPSMSYRAHYRRPARSKSLLEVQPPSRFDEDSCSDSTEMDLEDFNIDLEKYWEELEKPPSPIDLDMQRRNMHSNLKVKNVNVGCYNNGQPIDLHDREQERMMIKKSLLEGMPSPPQINAPHSYHFFEHSGSPLHQSYAPMMYGGHKVYPTVDTLPTYQYNNFYPEHATLGHVQTHQPSAGLHHPSASGHSALSLINNIFSIYKPNKYSPLNCQLNSDTKPEPCKKMNVPSTRRPLGAPHSEYMHSMKRPLIVSTEQPHFKIIPEKTGLKITPLYNFDEYGEKAQSRHKLTSTARPLMLPH